MCKAIFTGLAIGFIRVHVATAEESLSERKWKVDDVERQALLHVPASTRKSPTPVVFAFHGHGGTMKDAARQFAYHKYWPEAISVYMQGLPTPGVASDPEGKLAGWQRTVSDQKERDLKFFDAVLATLKNDYQIDEKRMYATGHSNGGGFTFILWSARGDLFAAVAPSAAGFAGDYKNLKPLPALQVAGEKDEIFPFEKQKRFLEEVRKLNGCDEEGSEWAKSGPVVGTRYPSKTGTPFVTLIYAGTHKFPEQAPELIVKFFKEHAKK